jgi:hypothetical protein
MLFQIIVTVKELQARLCWQFFTIEAENILSKLAFNWNKVWKTWWHQISFELNICKERVSTMKMMIFLQVAKNCQDVDCFYSSLALFFQRWSNENKEHINNFDTFNKDVNCCFYRLLIDEWQFFELSLNINYWLLSFISRFNLF